MYAKSASFKGSFDKLARLRKAALSRKTSCEALLLAQLALALLCVHNVVVTQVHGVKMCEFPMRKACMGAWAWA